METKNSLANNKIQQSWSDDYKTDCYKESEEEGVFEVVGKTCMTRSERSERAWCVKIYVCGRCYLMIKQLNCFLFVFFFLMSNNSKNPLPIFTTSISTFILVQSTPKSDSGYDGKIFAASKWWKLVAT